MEETGRSVGAGAGACGSVAFCCVELKRRELTRGRAFVDFSLPRPKRERTRRRGCVLLHLLLLSPSSCLRQEGSIFLLSLVLLDGDFRVRLPLSASRRGGGGFSSDS